MERIIWSSKILILYFLVALYILQLYICREYSRLQEKDHKVKSDLQDVDSSLTQNTARIKVLQEQQDDIRLKVASTL